MIKSTQRTLAKELSQILEPVLKKFSSRVIKDSVSFVDHLKDLNFEDTTGITMCSYDIVSLFTNVPLEETIQICVDTLYNTDLLPPDMSQDAFEELMLCVTKGIEFSFCDSV